MQVASISLAGVNTKNRVSSINQNYNRNLYPQNLDSVSFQRLLPKNAKIKIAFFDIDETLKHWDNNLSEEDGQRIRNELFDYVKSHKIQTVYSSDRGLEKIMPLIEDGTLAMPDWIVGNNGGFIYKNTNGKFEEIKTWSAGLSKNFNKDKVREIMVKIAHEKGNMFSQKEWANVPAEIIPEGQAEFRRSKITEYDGNVSPISMRFVMAPGMYEKNIKKIEQELKNHGIIAGTTLFHYSNPQITCGGLERYFSHQVALDIEHHYIPRSYPDGTGDSLLISATDKGMASEYIRKTLGLRHDQVFAAGDGENDFGNANKGYYFALISNAVEGLRKMISQTPKTNVIETTRPGAEGILEAFV